MVQGQVFLKGGGGGRLVLFPLNFFKVYYFYIQKLLYTLKKCVMHSKKYYFLPLKFYLKKSFEVA